VGRELWYNDCIAYSGGKIVTVPFGVKSYLPKLLKLGQSLCRYIRRYEDRIVAFLGEGGQAKLDAVLVACDALEVAIELILPDQV